MRTRYEHKWGTTEQPRRRGASPAVPAATPTYAKCPACSATIVPAHGCWKCRKAEGK